MNHPSKAILLKPILQGQQFAESYFVSQLSADDERLLIELRFENGHAIPWICYRMHSQSSSEVRKSSSGFGG